MRIAVAATLGLIVSLVPARAFDRLSCKAEDREVTFTVASQAQDSGRLHRFGGLLEIRRPGLAEAFRNLPLDDSHLAQHWANSSEIRLSLRHQRSASPYGVVALVIETLARADDANAFRGSYILTVFAEPTPGTEAQLFTLHGAATCTTE